jgi:stress-induced morphogen|tara:strand:- start:156 stop:413 length:258 start_codon:yes stop_codon:yes gene_type:complete
MLGKHAMPMDPGTIESLIKETLPDAEVTIEDLAGDGDHYAAHVVSGAFEGKTRVQQHQMVYQALQGRMGGELHALALQTSVPKDA